mgnify:CR=1 FL=1
MAKRAAGIAAAGIIFGCVAGGTMAGVNILADKLVPETVQSSEAPGAFFTGGYGAADYGSGSTRFNRE